MVIFGLPTITTPPLGVVMVSGLVTPESYQARMVTFRTIFNAAMQQAGRVDGDGRREFGKVAGGQNDGQQKPRLRGASRPVAWADH